LPPSFSKDGGKTNPEWLRQEFNFSTQGTAFEQENWRVKENGITHLRQWIKPDKGGKPCRASVTSLVLRSANT
jgi:hypothetical protein